MQLTAFLREDYYRLVEENGYEGADEIFLERWGDPAGMVMQAQTREVTRGVVPSTAFRDWARGDEANHLKDNFPAVWGFFGPDGGKFDAVAYVEQIRRGDREALTPREWLNLGQNHLGQMKYDEMLEQLGNPEDWDDADREFKFEIESMIQDEYPGFRDFTGTDTRATREQVMSQLDDALKDDAVKDSEIGQALSRYWRARNSTIEYAREELGLSARDVTYDLRRPRSLAADREWLYSIGSQLAEDYPAFERIWLRQLSYEVRPEEGDQ